MAVLQEAVANAIDFARETLGAERTRGIRLEEIEGTQDSWLITLSMIDPGDSDDPLARIQAVMGQSKREHKIFTARRDTGEIVAMKIREFANQ